MNKSAWNIFFLAWLVASVSSVGSLFFSEVMGFPPCSLCWYQRICMYPLVLFLGLGLIPLDPKVFRYVFPLAFVGWAFSVYHNLVVFKIVPEKLAPCSMGVPCSTSYISWFGFINIPFLSFIAFSMLLGLFLLFRKAAKTQ